MATGKKRTPKKGDRVTTRLNEGTFVVYSVDRTLCCADLAQIGSDLRLASVPWQLMRIIKKTVPGV
jgi:hypothetical protein